MSSKRPSAILIFSKAGDYGNVKTRMWPALSDEQCLSLHLALLEDTISKTMLIQADRVLYLSGSTALPFTPPMPVLAQQGKDLGERMRNAFEATLNSHDRVLITGTDSPTVSPEVFSKALHALNEADVALGPTRDGGYYLIALKKIIPEIFEEISWSTDQVFKQTLAKLDRFEVRLMAESFDVDRPEDLLRLKTEDLRYAPRTKAWLQKFYAR